eukprot:NODE_1476_length_937_cov_123.110360_g1144_i0.p1 GENE.NODE_1476_length_937_cov_123.110360_g1144_i0~~NODE_1476_length_937_cov_123.110360_g1144_i0.p1  ORF type:complete len:162 (+),score=29.78 NODE_1476_length_937_cov_123.110360_g1144_i0:450-935(+)
MCVLIVILHLIHASMFIILHLQLIIIIIHVCIIVPPSSSSYMSFPSTSSSSSATPSFSSSSTFFTYIPLPPLHLSLHRASISKCMGSFGIHGTFIKIAANITTHEATLFRHIIAQCQHLLMHSHSLAPCSGYSHTPSHSSKTAHKLLTLLTHSPHSPCTLR